MIELVRDWLVGVTCAAMAVALAQGLMPSGAVRKIGALTGALVLLLAVVQPILRVDGAALAQSLAQYRGDLGGYQAALESENEALMKRIIGEQAGAYILDKATEMGVVCTSVTVTTQLGEGGYPIPHAVEITGRFTAQEQAALTRRIEADFAIPQARQTYRTEDVE